MEPLYKTIDNILQLDEIPSTNDFLRSLLDSSSNSLSNGFVVSCRFQSSGRGQVGNKWHSEKDVNLLFSLLLYPDFVEIRDQFYISKAISIAIVKVLRSLFPAQASFFTIKWPNDIYYKDSKLAGILIENFLMGSSISNSIVGVGLNVDEVTFPAFLPNPISLRNINPQMTYTKEEILILLRDSILHEVDKLHHMEEYDSLSNQYLQYLYRYSVLSPFSDEKGSFYATIETVQADGKLVLLTDKGERKKYYFKEVEYLFD